MCVYTYVSFHTCVLEFNRAFGALDPNALSKLAPMCAEDCFA